MMKMRRKSSFVNRQRFDEMASIFRKINRNKLFEYKLNGLLFILRGGEKYEEKKDGGKQSLSS